MTGWIPLGVALGAAMAWGAPEKSVSPAEPKGRSCEVLRRTGRFSVHFDKVPIEELVQTVADATCRTFILTETVKGRISIVGPDGTTARVTAEQLYGAFLTALDANGFTVQERGPFVRVVEKSKGKQGSAPLSVNADDVLPGDDRVVTRVFTVSHADLEAVRSAVSGLVTPGGEAVGFPPDLLVVSDLGSNLPRIQRLLERLDAGGDDELRVFALQHALASQVAQKLGALADPRKRRPPLTMADERTNQLFVVAPTGAMERIAQLVHSLDAPLPGGGQVRVHRLKHLEAKELSPTLQALVAAGSRAAPQGPGSAQATLFSGEVRLSESESANAITVIAGAGDQQLVARLIDELDRPRHQVFIETALLEVNVDRDHRLAIEGHRIQAVDTPAGPLPVFLGNAASEGGPRSLSLKNLASLTGLLAGVQGPVPTALKELNLPEFGVLIQALQKSSDVNVLSTPHLLTTDNKEAEISVGQKVPFRTLSGPPAAPPAVPGAPALEQLYPLLSANVTRENVELRLTVKPHLGEGDAVRLEISEKTEELGTALEKGLGPTTSTRGAKTMVVARDGQTVVLGGIMQDRALESVSKVPVLGDLPLLGHLFRDTYRRSVKTNLLLVLTPHIVREPADFARILERKLRERDRFAAEFYGEVPGLEQQVDFGRKRGPWMAMRRALRGELARPENGGDGAPEERVVRPSEPPKVSEPLP